MEDFDATSFIDEVSEAHDVLVGQYFEGEYCPTLVQIESMYLATDISTIEVPLSVKDMFESEV